MLSIALKQGVFQPRIRPVTLFFSAATIILLYLSSLVHYLLFHSLAELFSIVIASAFFMISWNSRRLTTEPSLVYLGIAYLFIGIMDLFHTLSYKGMAIFPDYDFYANQVWIAARYVESLTLLSFFALVGVRKKFSYAAVFILYATLTTVLLLSVFYWRIFPVCFVEGQGLTLFKKISEYIICLILAVALVAIHKNRESFSNDIYPLLTGSILLTIGGELAFTFYISNYGFSNLVGHFLKIGSFYLIYKAIIETSLKNPFDMIFRQLAESEQQHRNLFNMALVGIFRVRMDGSKVMAANPAAAAVAGCDSVKQMLAEFVPRKAWADPVQRKRVMKRLEKGERVDHLETIFVDRRGNRKNVALSIAAYPEGGYMEGAILDVTESVENKRRIAEAAEQAALQRGKIEMAVNVLHDIGNAVTGLGTRVSRLLGESDWEEIEALGNLQEMVRQKRDAFAIALGPGKDEAFEIFVRELRQSMMERNRNLKDDFAAMSRTVSHVNEILHLQRQYAVEGTGRRAPLDMIELMEDALAMTAASLQKRDIAVERRFHRPVPPVSGDRTRLIQVMINLLKNAGEAFDSCKRKDDRKLIVEVGTKGAGLVCVAIEDNACGFDCCQQKQIFERGFSTKNRSSGMGLSQCQDIVSSHGGTLELKTAGPGRGATAIIELPGAEE